MQGRERMILRFAEFTLDDGAGVLSGPDGPIALRPRSFALLKVLVERAPDLVGHDQLIDAVWGHDALSPNVLPQTISEIRQALGDSAQAPRLVGTQHRRGYRLLVPVERLEAAAPQSASVPAPHPATGPSPATGQARAVAPRLVHGLLALAGAIVLAALLALGRPGPEPAPQPAQGRPALALLARAADGEADWLRAAGSSLLTVALAADDRLQLLRGDGRDGDPGGSDARWQAWLRDVLGARHALDVTWSLAGDEVALAWSLLDLDDGRVQAAGQARDRDLAAACRLAAREVRDALRLIESDPAWLAGLPQAAGARQAYYRGLAALAGGESGRAVADLSLAVADAGAGVRVRLALATALRQAGDLQQAREQFEQVLAQPESLSVGERLRAEAEAALAAQRPGDAVQALAALQRLLPDDREVAFALADAQLQARRPEAAAGSLATLDTLASGEGEDPRWHLLRARLHLLEHRRAEAIASAQRALALAQALGLSSQATQASIDLAQMARADGDLAGARGSLQAVLERGAASPDLIDEARLQMGGVLRDLGDFEASASVLAQAREGFAGRGDRAGVLRAAIELHIIDSERSRSEQAMAALRTLGPEIEGLGDARLAARWHNTLGMQALRNGQVESAEQHLEQAAGLARRGGLPAVEAGAWGNLGQVRARQRRLPEAEAYWERALEVFHDSGDRMGEAITLGNLAAAASAQGRLPRSRDLNRRALVLLRTLDARQHLARTAYNLGLVLEREGEIAQAEALYEEAATAYAAGAAGDPLASAAAALARVRLARGDPAGAGQALDAAEANLGEGAGALARSHLLAQRGQLAGAAGRRDQARRLHQQALALRREEARPGWAELSELDLLALDLDAGGEPGDHDRVRAAAERIAERLARQGDIRAGVRARLLEAEALLRLGQGAAVLALVESGRQRLAEEPDAALSLALDRLRVLAAGERGSSRTARLAGLAEEAEALGLVLLALRCRLDAHPDDAALVARVRGLGLAGLLAGP